MFIQRMFRGRDMLQHKVEEIGAGEVKISFIPAITNKATSISIKNTEKDGSFTKFYTATTQMKDFIGNILSINQKYCVVKGVYQGQMQEIKNIKICFDGAKIGERVMVTEHLDLDGRFELLATKHRILQGDLNFINCGWKSGNKINYYRIDIYTGLSKLFVAGE